MFAVLYTFLACMANIFLLFFAPSHFITRKPSGVKRPIAFHTNGKRSGPVRDTAANIAYGKMGSDTKPLTISTTYYSVGHFTL